MQANKDLCTIFGQLILIILGGIGIGIGTDSAWVGAGAALIGIGVASGPLLFAVFDRFIVVEVPRRSL